jgi:Mrp family chromosome partitioning ATPase
MNKACPIDRQHLGEAGARPASNGVVISLFGAKGGIGKTTLATNLAVALTQLRNESVALMDIDTRFGDVAIVLDLQPERNISETVNSIDEIDRTNIKSFLTHTPAASPCYGANASVGLASGPASPWERLIAPERDSRFCCPRHTRILHELVGTALDTPTSCSW